MFYDNLKHACEKNNVKISPTVVACGGKTGSINGWKKGSIPNAEIVMALSLRLNVSTDFLLFGIERYDEDQTNQEIDKPRNKHLSADERDILTYYNALDEGAKEKAYEIAEFLSKLASNSKTSDDQTTVQLGNASDEPELVEDRILYIETYSLPASAGAGVDLDNCEKDQVAVRETDLTSDANFAIRVSGRSMEPEYHDGDIVLVRTQPEVEIGQVGIFIIDGRGYIKQRGRYELISINPDYENVKVVSGDTCYCRGLVIGILPSCDLM